MKRRIPGLLFAVLVVTSLDACSGGASDSPISGDAAGSGGATGTGGATGGSGPTSNGGTTGSGGAAGSVGADGTGGAPMINADGSVDAAAVRDANPLMGVVKIMVAGSSNELGTCWRALLWQKLHANGITNFEFVGAQNTGPDCGVPGYDKHVQAQSGIIISNLPASTYAGWFKAHPPQIILMHFGGADLLANMPVAGVMKAYSTALAQARLVNPQVVLLIGQHTPEGRSSILQLNADIAMWAMQNSTAASPVIAVDLYTGILPSDQSDGVHLNMSGSRKVADKWYVPLAPLLKP
jgi:hypothetical protein